jgi:hypothetical protein
MKRRILAGLLSVLICLGAVANVSGAASGEAEASSVTDVSSGEAEASGASDASSEELEIPRVSIKEDDDSYTMRVTDRETGEEITSFDLGSLEFWGQDVIDLINNINKRMAEVDPDELAANMLAVNATLRSSEFEHLWDYEAFQNLVIEVLASVLDFAKEDGELSVKILTKLGLSNQIAEILIECIQSSRVTGDDIRKIPPEKIYEGLQDILDMMDKLTGSDMFSSLLKINDSLESGNGGGA